MCVILDFVYLAQYCFYTNETLTYLEDVLYRIDYTKEIFCKCRKNQYFNFPKWHIIIYYPAFIRKYKVAPSYSININEICHIDNVKKLFDHTNKCIGFKRQLFKYSIHYLNAFAAYNVELFSAGFRHGYIEHTLKFYVNIALKGVPLNYK